MSHNKRLKPSHGPYGRVEPSSILEKITRAAAKISRCKARDPDLYLSGTMVVSRSAAMRSASGGCVLKSEESVPPPNMGLTIQSEDVDGEIAVVGIRLL